MARETRREQQRAKRKLTREQRKQLPCDGCHHQNRHHMFGAECMMAGCPCTGYATPGED